MSSHREAPEVSKDAVADNTDVYAFVSPDAPGTVTLISNYIPFENPTGAPSFYEFGEDVLYSIYIDNNGDAKPDVTYNFRFTSQTTNPDTFLYATGPIHSLTDPSWNRRQSYSVTRVAGNPSTAKVLGTSLPCPPCNVGPRSTPDYTALADAAVVMLATGEKVFAGQRRDPFVADVGAFFDIGDIRPAQPFHLIQTGIPSADESRPSVDALSKMNVHSIAIQVPIARLTRDGSVPTDPMSATSVLGIWAAASRQKARILNSPGNVNSGPWVQVSRLGNPLFNEVVVPVARKDEWNGADPVNDVDFLPYAQHPEIARSLPVIYPALFPNLAGITGPRDDLVAIFLTGMPTGFIPGFQNYTGKTYADMLRLNVAIPPSSNPDPLGVIAGDLAGFPNGRRVTDDSNTVETRAAAGLTYPLVNPSYVVDPAAFVAGSGLVPGPDRYLPTFPYVGVPLDGFDNPPVTQ
jgi:hypothetical protein